MHETEEKALKSPVPLGFMCFNVGFTGFRTAGQKPAVLSSLSLVVHSIGHGTSRYAEIDQT
jgi:hypothetical protein